MISKAWIVFKVKVRVNYIPSFILSDLPVHVAVIDLLIKTVKHKSATLHIKLGTGSFKLEDKLGGYKNREVGTDKRALAFKRKVLHVKPGHAVQRYSGFERHNFVE